MTTIYDVPLKKFQDKLVEELKKIKEIQIPEWSKFVKTGPNKERTPVEKDWWFIRAGSILRQIYKKGPIGVNKLRIRYGSKKNRGYIPEKFYKASGKVIRTILQQIESSGLIEQRKKGSHKGRVVTNKGKSFMDKIASSVSVKTKVKDKKEVKEKVKETTKPKNTEKVEDKVKESTQPKVEGKKETKITVKEKTQETNKEENKEKVEDKVKESTQPKVEDKKEVKTKEKTQETNKEENKEKVEDKVKESTQPKVEGKKETSKSKV